MKHTNSAIEAQKIDEDYEAGEEFSDEIKLQDFGRRAIMALRQNLKAKIAEREKNNIFLKYTDKINEIVVGEIYQIWKKILILDDEGIELILPKAEQIPNDRYRKGDTIRAVVISVSIEKVRHLLHFLEHHLYSLKDYLN